MKKAEFDPVALCKEKGVAATAQRIAILKTMHRMGGHPSVEEVYHEVRKDVPTISLATVYNNLHFLSLEGILPRPLPMPNLVRYETSSHPHHHLACMLCNKLVDLPAEAVPEISLPEEMRQGYQIRGYRLVFEGICPDCQKELAENN